MRSAPSCPRCGGQLHPPSPWSSSWTCDAHGIVYPLQPVLGPGPAGLEEMLSVARVPVWLPWPLPDRWVVAGCAYAGDERTGARACALACSGPAPLGGPGDLVLVAEEPGVGLGAYYAGLPGPDPGEGFDRGPPHAKVHGHGHPVPLWSVDSGPDRAVFAGEAKGLWLWALLWPAAAGVLLVEEVRLVDLSDVGHEPDLPYGPLSPRLLGAIPDRVWP